MPAIDGLASGLDSTSIINQLMQIERLPQQRLSSRRIAALAQVTTWTQTGAALKALQAAAQGLSREGALARTTATSSNAAVGISATAAAPTGSHTLTVRTLAAAHSLGSSNVTSGAQVVGAGALVLGRGLSSIGVTTFGTALTGGAASGTYDVEVASVNTRLGTANFVINGTLYADVNIKKAQVEVGGLRFDTATLKAGSAEVTVARTGAGATVDDVAAQLNGAQGVASGAVVQTSPTTAKLLLTSDTTGTAGALRVATEGNLTSLTFTDVRAAADATFELDGLLVTRSSNTVTDLLPGVTLNLTAPATGVTIGVAADNAGSATAVKGVVTALNTLLSGLATATAYDPLTRKSGTLAGDAGARGLLNTFRETVGTAAAGAATALRTIGLGLQNDGTYAFDEATFAAALAKDPAGVAELVGKVSTALATAAKDAMAPEAAVSSGKEGAGTRARELQAAVDAYDQRLALTQSRLQRQFNSLERALSLMQSQGNALSGALGSLAGFGSSD